MYLYDISNFIAFVKKEKKKQCLTGVNHAKLHINKPRIILISLAHPEVEFQNSQSGIAWSALLE